MIGAVPHLLVLGGFAALMAAAAFEDFRRLVIPNRLVLGLCALWLLRPAVMPASQWLAALETAGAAVAIFVAGALLFSRGLVGGGDVKLLSAAALWAGAVEVPALLLVTALFGGLLSLVCLTPAGARLAAARTALRNPADRNAATTRPIAVPYGVAIAAAALFVTIPPRLG